ncbi:hypothetical protein Tco_1304700 [Tanacetum coccineum]
MIGTSSSSSDTKISHLPTSLVDKALTISRTYDGHRDRLVSSHIDHPQKMGLFHLLWIQDKLSSRLGPLDWDNLMSRQLTTGTSNSLDEQRGVLRFQSAGHVLAATAFSTYICL